MQKRRLQQVAALVAALTVFMLGSAAVCGAAAADFRYPITFHEPAQPNPNVEYESLTEMALALGFTPLTLPEASGYDCTKMSIIDGVTADLAYISRDKLQQEESTFSIRSAEMAKTASLKGDISGLYGVKWQKTQMGSTTVYIGKIDSKSFAVRWVNGKYAFAAMARNISKEAFQTIVRELLVPATERGFGA